jgi:hypothetical protein
MKGELPGCDHDRPMTQTVRPYRSHRRRRSRRMPFRN